MTVSWIILTYNRGEIVKRSVTHNFDCAGAVPDELIWVDNGSTDKICREFMQSMDPEVSVLHNENRGVAKGYNAAMTAASKDYIVITGSDMLLPNNWLATFKEYVATIPNTGSACIYSSHWTEKPERHRKQYGIQVVNDLPLVHAMPIERRIFRRSLLTEFGYYPESFGLYGFDDIAYAHRIEKVCDEMGLLYYCIPDLVAEHLGTEGIARYDGKDAAEYHAMKQKEARDSAKRVELERLRNLGWPKFDPHL